MEGDILRIPKIGLIPVVVHRPIPDGFVLKTATISFKADGYYVSISAEDATIPESKFGSVSPVQMLVLELTFATLLQKVQFHQTACLKASDIHLVTARFYLQLYYGKLQTVFIL